MLTWIIVQVSHSKPILILKWRIYIPICGNPSRIIDGFIFYLEIYPSHVGKICLLTDVWARNTFLVLLIIAIVGQLWPIDCEGFRRSSNLSALLLSQKSFVGVPTYVSTIRVITQLILIANHFDVWWGLDLLERVGRIASIKCMNC